MPVNDQPWLLDDERGQTDSSLVSARGKADDSFANHRKQIESETDRRVKSDRKGADLARALSRENTDVAIVLESSGRASLQAQRNLDDAAVGFERSLMDEALVRERQLNDMESNKFLNRERKEADKNLLRERTHTDSAALVSWNLLNTELTSHKVTKAALTSRDEFLAIVSHDLRNPIGAILSFAELLLEEFPRSEKDALKWTGIIQRNAETALRMINDILDVERFAEGKLQVKFAPRDVGALIRETVESFQNVASERKITLRSYPSEKNPLINCDRDRIGQVLANLIGNAIKFTPEDGSVTVAAIQVANELRVSVTDTGPGVADEQKRRIFERYAQLGNKERQGLGLGLYISSMLVEAHHGKIGVASAPGSGSIFYFTLPIMRPGCVPGPNSKTSFQ